MFSKPGEYDVIMRYSSLTPKLVPDNVPAPRGIGMKIFGVEGEKIWGEDKKTQDWTFNNYPILELRNPVATQEIAESLEKNWNQLDKFAEYLKGRDDAEVACRPASIPNVHSEYLQKCPDKTNVSVMSTPEYSQTPYRHGDYIAKYGVFPHGEAQKAREKELIKSDDPINCISQELQKFHKENTVTYSFCAQLAQNLDEQPIEDCGIEWDEKKYPFEEIGTLEFEPQDSWIPEFRVWWDDRITVNSWHGLKTHQPLGSTNRLRRVVYAESRKLRLKVNGYDGYVEPAGLKEVLIRGVCQRLWIFLFRLLPKLQVE